MRGTLYNMPLLILLMIFIYIPFLFAQPGETYVPNEVLFKLQSPFASIGQVNGIIVTEAAWFNVLAVQYKIVELRPIFQIVRSPYRGWYRAKFLGKVAVPSVVDALQSNSAVLKALPNALITFFQNAVSDPLFEEQWNLPMIKAVDAWDIISGSSDVVVADIDLGCRISHEDLTNQLWTNVGEIPNDNQDNDGNGYEDDYHGVNTETETGRAQDLEDVGSHGTAVSAIFAAETNNGKGIAGVAGGGIHGDGGVRLMVVKVPVTESPTQTNAADIAEGISYATEEGADIVNMSFGMDPSDPDITPISEAIRDGADHGRGGLGIIYLASSGNVVPGGGFPQYGDDVFPANHLKTIAVGAVGPDGQWSTESNYATWLDVVAPGDQVLSACATSDNCYNDSLGFGGTSLSSPHAAGLAALMLSVNPNLTRYDARNIIRDTATDLGDPTRTGQGLINAHTAVLEALDSLPARESISTQATAHNGGRRLVKEGSNLYLVYESGVAEPVAAGEPFVYYSYVGEIDVKAAVPPGHSWQTDPIVLMSDGKTAYVSS